MKNRILYIWVLALVLGTVQAQQLKNPMSAKSPAELELIFKNNFTIQHEAVLEKARLLNVPVREEMQNGEVREMVGISSTGMPVYYQTTNNIDAAKTISTNKVWPGGTLGLNLTGSGMTNRLGVWDGGRVLTTHQEFNGRATQSDGASTLSDHATHVTGTMIATGVVSNAKGMSYQATIKCNDWNSDESEMSSAASLGMLVSNHSYSQISGWQYNSNLSRWEFWGDPNISTIEDYKYGFYDIISQDWDQIAVNYPNYLPFVAAGNDRGEPGTIPSTFYIRNTSGSWVLGNSANPPLKIGPYSCIVGGSANAKNVMTIGAVNKITTGWTKASDVVMSTFSCWGPTDDGRIKPDVVANGVSVYSSIATSSTSYSTFNGTSMATPNASGSALLIQQHYNNLKGSYMRASTLKGLIIHTADEAGTTTGPDYTYGWGLMNTAKAVSTITDTLKSVILQNTASSLGTYTYTIFTDGTAPIRATICWTDRPGTPPPASLNPSTRMLVNDLDVRIKRNADNQLYYPYKLDVANPGAAATTGDNNIDNVEQVYIANPLAGTYTITVTSKGSLVGSTQNYALIVSGITPKPMAAFTTANRVICSQRTTVFTDQSSGAVSRMWYFPGGTPATSTATNPSVSYAVPGVYPVALRISSATGYDSIYKDDYIKVGGLNLPLIETFESNSPTRAYWTVENPNSDTTWRLWNIAGNSPGNTAYGINNFDFPTFFYSDRLVSPVLDLRGYQNALLEFQHAYTRYDTSSSDSLIIYVSTNCGTSYIRLAAYGEGGKGTYATGPDSTFASANRFVPSKAADWCGGGIGSSCYSVNLSAYVGNPNVKIRFEQKSNAGNNMFLDNIKFTGTSLGPVANFYAINKTVCVGDELQLLDSSRNNPDQYTWYVSDADTLTYTIRNPKVKFISAGTKNISLVVKNAAGMDSIAKQGYINVLPSPVQPSISSSKGLTLCDGDSTIISSDATTNFVWYKDNLAFSTSLTSFQNKDEAGFFIRVAGTNGCYAKSEELKITAGLTPSKPVITKDLSGFVFCEGGSFNLYSSSLFNNQWFLNDTVFAGKTDKTLNYGNSGEFKLRVNDKGCFSFSDSMVITKLLRPATSEIQGNNWGTKGDTATYSVIPGASGSTFSWTVSGGSIQAGAGTSQVLVKFGTSATATINVQENGSNNCSGSGKNLLVTLVNTGIAKQENDFGLQIFPNPAQSFIRVQTETRQSAEMEIGIYNVLGQNMHKEWSILQSGLQSKEINLQSLPAGMYLIRIQAGDKIMTRSFVKE